jgi:hypothetical protein
MSPSHYHLYSGRPDYLIVGLGLRAAKEIGLVARA